MTAMLRAAALLLVLAAPARAQAPAATRPVDQPTAGLFEATAPRAPAATAASGRAVVTAADPRAAAAGIEMLRAGGTATDAAIAVMLALTVVEPQSSGIGGGGFYLRAAPGEEAVTIDGRETAPAAATPGRFLGPDGAPLPFRQAQEGGQSVGVPGALATAAAAHARYGKLPWARLFAPAIRLARNGFDLTPRLRRTLTTLAPKVAASAAARTFLPGGAPPTAGARVRQPELARTLERIARDGPAAFYGGEVGRAVVAAAGGVPAPLTAADLAAYRVVHRAPLCAPYRGWRVCGMGPPSSGGLAVIAILRQLERFDLAKLGRDDPLAWHLIAESQRLAFADRAAWVADPGFVAVPVDGLLDLAYLAGRSALIRFDRAMADAPAGAPPGAPPPPPRVPGDDGGTSHFAVAAGGEVVNWTNTIESIFGAGVVAGGFFLNNELTDFDLQPTRAGRPAPNRVEAGKRPRSSMAPTLLYGPDGSLRAALGGAGGSTIIAQVAKTAIAIIDWRLPVEDAIAEPVLFAGGPRLAYERGTKFERMAATWKALGHDPVAAALPLKTNAIVRDGSRWRGAADPRSEGQALALP